MVIRPHDLIEIADLSCLSRDEDKEWTAVALRRTPFVVVRRAEALPDGRIPVGIRGAERNQREAAWLAPMGTGRIITPYEIAEQRLWTVLPAVRRELPVLRIMDKVADLMKGWRWGPAGSAGFEMVTGQPALKESSDLDLVIDSPELPGINRAVRLLHELDQLPVRVDIQLEMRKGAYLLREIAGRRAGTVVLRTASGPRLVKHPWQ